MARRAACPARHLPGGGGRAVPAGHRRQRRRQDHAAARAEHGRIFWRGRDILEDREAFHSELNYLGHDNGLKADLTAAENLHYAAALRRRARPQDIALALERTGVAEAAGQLLRHLSAGQRRRVALARLALTGGSLWVLDEPGSNLDERGHAALAELIDGHLRAGGAAVVATHRVLDLAAAQLRSLTLQ